ncbi:nucleoside triphosphate hydrolase [Altererythrobacter indicus]|uniref:Nucleoside triphosphate hydrolase n=1 Tax=Altericroceibacterium indicum TaxID=374177 RepID=A0A845A6X1_9SPHN|nr:nucleoside triphosphate hydrolase [Altericroceibacterium indicum]MXP25414.1 nucleoside triphosphate hydrolase [Altericroceibacterium indicum]
MQDLNSAQSPLPPLIAVVGCDGSGKSTVTEELKKWLSTQGPTQICHLGKQSGNIGRRIARLPLLGKRLDKSIHSKAQKAQVGDGPKWPEATVIWLFSMRRVRRFARMMRLRRQGFTIIADRFPQLSTPGPMDGLGLANAKRGGAVALLARKERQSYEAMVANRPDLVLRLNVSLEVALARKPDHRPSSLARKVNDVPKLSFGAAPIVDINADQPLEDVLAQAKAAIADMLAARENSAADNVSNMEIAG